MTTLTTFAAALGIIDGEYQPTDPAATGRQLSDSPARAAAHTDQWLVEDHDFFTRRRESACQWLRDHGPEHPERTAAIVAVVQRCGRGIRIVECELAQRGRLDLLPDPFDE